VLSKAQLSQVWLSARCGGICRYFVVMFPLSTRSSPNLLSLAHLVRRIVILRLRERPGVCTHGANVRGQWLYYRTAIGPRFKRSDAGRPASCHSPLNFCFSSLLGLHLAKLDENAVKRLGEQIAAGSDLLVVPRDKLLSQFRKLVL